MTRLGLPLVLVGLPGAGKTRVGRLLAEALAVPHIDTDALIEQDAGCSISDIFSKEGENAFRERERRAVTQALKTQAVISLGGGAVTIPAVRDLLSEHHVVFIDVEQEELLRRVARKTHRPLLQQDPEETLRRLHADRDSLYRQVATHIEVSDASPAQEVAQRILSRFGSQPVVVNVGGAAGHTVVIGRGLGASHVRSALRRDCQKILLVHAAAVTTPASRIADDLRMAGLDVVMVSPPDAEAGKRIEVVAELWDVAAEMRMGRHDAILAVGGGATSDMAGFVAATWLRGIDVIHIPTTLLAMVDAAIGGKTGINTGVGKNLVGSFHTPVRVLVDLEHLATLPLDDVRAGMAEVIKCGFIRDPRILELVEDHGGNALDVDSPVLHELVTRAVQVKAEVVSQDPKESGLREILNYGHTMAHAIERCENYRWRHGDAVAVGCVFAAHLSHTLGMLDLEGVHRHEKLFSCVALPTTYSGASLEDLVNVMLSDKKTRAGSLRFVLLDEEGCPHVVPVDSDVLSVPASRVGIDVC